MMKKTILLLLSTLVFSACVERGSTLQPKSTVETTPIQKMKPIETNTTVVRENNQTTKIDTIQKTKAVETNTTEVHENNQTTYIETKTTNFNFLDLTNLSHDTKNTLSGMAILIIGLIILL